MAARLLTGGSILTMDPARPRVDAVGTAGETIVACGTETEVAAALGEGAERVDLGGGALLPAFIDAHHHYCMAALDRRTPDLHAAPGEPIAALLDRLGQAAGAGGSPWVRAQGYDASKLAERRAPRREELDEVCPDRPLLLIAYSFHEGVLNSAGLAQLGWDETTPDPPGGALGRRRGRLTGEVIEAAFFQAEAASRNALLQHAGDAWLTECQAHGRELLAAGIVRVGDAAVPPAIDALYERAVQAGMLPVKVHRMPVGGRSMIQARVDGASTGAGPRAAPVGAAKLFLDGADRCAICASPLALLGSLTRTVRSALGGQGLAVLRAATTLGGGWHMDRHGLMHRGVLFWEPGELDATIAAAAEHGLQVAQHAIGNEAIAAAVGALERAGSTLAALPGPPRLEHAMLLDGALARRIASVGATAVVNPHFVFDLGDELASMPLPGGLRAVGLRTLTSAGVELAGSSDYPVSSYDVMAALRAAATRLTRGGRTLEPEEAIDVELVLRAYTAGAARALGVHEEAGTLAPGRRADMVVLSEDPLRVDPAALDSLRVLRTYVDGEPAYDADSGTAGDSRTVGDPGTVR
jgi:predicted amidohydrolase YtcJ